MQLENFILSGRVAEGHEEVGARNQSFDVVGGDTGGDLRGLRAGTGTEVMYEGLDLLVTLGPSPATLV